MPTTSLWEHWKRGARISIFLGLVLLASVAMATIALAGTSLIAELVLPSGQAQAFEGRNTNFLVFILTVGVFPAFISQTWDTITAAVQPAKPDA